MQAESIEIRLHESVVDAARAAAGDIARSIRRAAAARGRCTLALSGGASAKPLLGALAAESIPWDAVQLFQVDERIAPANAAARNLQFLRAELLQRVAIPIGNVHVIPVEHANPNAAAEAYARRLRELAGEPPVMDVVHLGLGRDGHTASLVPDDPLLDEHEAQVGVSREYMGYRRITLTYPCLRRARKIVWFVTGAAKAKILQRLLHADDTIPAGRLLNHECSIVYADFAAAGGSASVSKPPVLSDR